MFKVQVSTLFGQDKFSWPFWKRWGSGYWIFDEQLKEIKSENGIEENRTVISHTHSLSSWECLELFTLSMVTNIQSPITLEKHSGTGVPNSVVNQKQDHNQEQWLGTGGSL